ncbi:hypothetical protein HYH03_010751 [Edaphochlamys debaryana]|uniref:Uncharacterized protein n=1 Tax=Edaphochlamys debaryana TaxID=47281 RepID=A0A835XVZ5_9CHLO|nr:hypothetical protein HYH03_010751 [Edaphochlamys debaryana]|eukprot:KAG2490830.1 hypothetical protein HYH03_010751 [Edaphochlamys debaryana]
MQASIACRAVASAPRRQVRTQAVAEEPTASFKLPKKQPLPTDAAGVKALIAKSHEMHGQGRSMWFCLTGRGKRATAGTYIAHADALDWNAASSGSVDSYNIYS